MELTAYFDESGTHDDSPVAAMAGFVGDKRQWAKFEKRVKKLFARYKVSAYHTVDVRRTKADFKGWTVDRKIEFLDEFQYIINETMLGGVAAFIKREDYDYYGGLTWPKGTRKDSEYGILFRACLSQTIDTVGHLPLMQEPKLRIVLEDGHPNRDDALRIYNWAAGRIGQHRALSGLEVDDKSCLPLAAADLFAYSAWGAEVGQKPIGTPKGPTKSDASYRGNVFKVVLVRDSLNSLHEQAIHFAATDRAALAPATP
jgi:hypothetical protein